MSLKPGGGPETLPLTMTISGQGSSDKVKLVYHNRKASEIEARMKEANATFGGLIPFVVKEWDLEFPLTEDGVKDMEDEYPGMIQNLLEGFGRVRRKEAEKN